MGTWSAQSAWSAVINAPVSPISPDDLELVGTIMNANTDAREDESLGIDTYGRGSAAGCRCCTHHETHKTRETQGLGYGFWQVGNPYLTRTRRYPTQYPLGFAIPLPIPSNKGHETRTKGQVRKRLTVRTWCE
jgi:hypothetical protein